MLICIIVHINEVSAYEYAFLFCCLIKKRERGGDHDRAGDGAEQKYGGRVNYDFRDISTILGWGGSQACVSKFNKMARDNTTAHTVEYTHHWRSRTSKTGKNYSSTTVALLQTSCSHTMRTESSLRFNNNATSWSRWIIILRIADETASAEWAHRKKSVVKNAKLCK